VDMIDCKENFICFMIIMHACLAVNDVSCMNHLSGLWSTMIKNFKAAFDIEEQYSDSIDLRNSLDFYDLSIYINQSCH
jgi:hypothetical protein